MSAKVPHNPNQGPSATTVLYTDSTRAPSKGTKVKASAHVMPGLNQGLARAHSPLSPGPLNQRTDFGSPDEDYRFWSRGSMTTCDRGQAKKGAL